VRIILLTQWFYPEPGHRVHQLAAELVKRGHEVQVVTGYPTYPYDRFYEGYAPGLYDREEYEGAKVLRLPHFSHSQRSAVRRILNYVSYSLSAMILGNALIRRADVMYVLMPPPLLGLAAKCISMFHRIPLVYDVQDIWPDAIEASGFECSNVVKRSLKLIEKTVYTFAKAISVPSEGYKRNLVEKGVGEDRITVIPNWADEQIYRPESCDGSMAKQYGVHGKFTIVYAGNIGYSQSIHTILDAAAMLLDKADIRFVLAGDGASFQSMKQVSNARGLKNVVFTGRLPVEAMPSLFSIADLLVIHLRNHPIFRITIPSKTQAYMACGKPILMAVEGDAAELIRTTNSGVTCRQENATEMSEAILKVYGMTLEERRTMGDNALRTCVQRFLKADIVERYERLFYHVIA
jgi:colanic acid biosynthesis glycosyl transferase WcaI